MNAQLHRQHDILDDSIPRSSARAPSTALPGTQSPPVAEDLFLLSKQAPPAQSTARRVEPLWMITGAAALLFIFLAAAVSFS